MFLLNQKNYFYFAVAFISCGLLFFNLGQIPFWDDEAMVYWFADIYNQTGDLRGWDGYNLYSFRNGALFQYNNPPLDIYFTALIRRYISSDIAIVRAGFACLGMLSIFFFYKIISKLNLEEVWKKFAFVCFVLHIDFILYSRNCRYYALTILLGLMIYDISILYASSQKSKMKSIYAFLLSCLFSFLFFAHYTQAIVWLIFCSLVFYRKSTILESLKKNKSLIFFYTLMIMGWIYYGISKSIHVRTDLVNEDFFIVKILKLTVWLIHDLNRYNVVPIWLSAFILGTILLKKYSSIYSDQAKSILLQVGIFFLLCVSISPQDTSHSGSYDFRYLFVGFFLFPILVSFFLFYIFSNLKKKWVAISLCFVYLNSTLLCFIPVSTPIRLTISSFILEKTGDYHTPISELMDYLKPLKPIQTVTCIPEFHNTSILAMRSKDFRFSNVIDSATNIQESIVRRLGANWVYKSTKPDYFFLFGDRLHELEKYKIDLSDYDAIDTLPVFSTFLEYSRPELTLHSFETMSLDKCSKDCLVIYKRKLDK